MPILIKNQIPAKGQKAQFELNKSALTAITSVAADSYFSQISNWSHVELMYKSSLGNQRTIVKFDATKSTPLAIFYVSSRARDIFQIDKIVINDFDGGEFTVHRNELNTSEFDVDMSPGSVGVPVVWNNGSTGEYFLTTSGGATPLFNNAGVIFKSPSTSSANYTIEYKFNGYLSGTGGGSYLSVFQGSGYFSENIGVKFDGTEDPKVVILGSASYKLSDYGLPLLNSGENIVKLIKSGASWAINVNGTQASIGSVSLSSWSPLISITNTASSLISAKEL